MKTLFRVGLVGNFCGNVRESLFIGTTRKGAQTIPHTSETSQPLRVLYDGQCRFCCAGARRLSKMALPGSLRLINFQEPGVLREFPGIDYETCMRHMLLVTPEGRKFAGAEAIVQALATRGGLTRVVYLYYVPGIRQFSDVLYWCVARMRYYILGKIDPCKDGTCRI